MKTSPKVFIAVMLALTVAMLELSAPRETRGAVWTTNSPLHASRGGQTATLLANGKLLIAGGCAQSTAINSAELYDPALGT